MPAACQTCQDDAHTRCATPYAPMRSCTRALVFFLLLFQQHYLKMISLHSAHATIRIDFENTLWLIAIARSVMITKYRYYQFSISFSQCRLLFRDKMMTCFGLLTGLPYALYSADISAISGYFTSFTQGFLMLLVKLSFDIFHDYSRSPPMSFLLSYRRYLSFICLRYSSHSLQPTLAKIPFTEEAFVLFRHAARALSAFVRLLIRPPHEIASAKLDDHIYNDAPGN